MKKSVLLSAILSLSLCFLLNPAFSEESKNLQIRKQPEIQQVKPRKPVRIKLKRSTEGEYTWDLSGDDADEIVKADKPLRKLLNIE